MHTIIRCVLLLICFIATPTMADVQVFPVRGANSEQVLDALRASLGDRAKVDLIQQQIVVVGDKKTLAEAVVLLEKFDRLPANFHLTLTETLPSTSTDSETGTVVYTAEKNAQMVDTLEGAMVSLDYTKFHQTVESDGWMFSVNEKPVAIKQLQLNVKLLDAKAKTVQVTMSFARHENQERKVYGRIVAGKIGDWIPLLPQRAQMQNDNSGTVYSSGERSGEQLYLKVERIGASKAH